jgi:lactoylglutathione lyase
VIIETGQLKRMAEFYRQGLELPEPEATGDDHLGFSTGSVYFGFDRVERERKEMPGPISVWFEVDDLEASFRRFTELGAEVRFPPTKKPWGAILAAVMDPDGNIVGLSQRGAFPK